MFTLLQFKESVEPLISLIISILLVISYFVWFVYLSVALNSRKKGATKIRDSRRRSRSRPSRSKTPDEQEEEQEIGDIPESMNMVVDEFVRKNWYSRNFLLIMSLQNAIIGFVLVFLQNWGIIQAGSFPTIQRKITRQLAKGSMGCLALVLGLDKQFTLFSEDQRNAIGIALITLASVGIFSNLLLCVGMIGKTIIDFYHEFRKRRKEKRDIQLRSHSRRTTNNKRNLLGESQINTRSQRGYRLLKDNPTNNSNSFITGLEESIGMKKK